jgi:hypothetical protein
MERSFVLIPEQEAGVSQLTVISQAGKAWFGTEDSRLPKVERMSA